MQRTVRKMTKLAAEIAKRSDVERCYITVSSFVEEGKKLKLNCVTNVDFVDGQSLWYYDHNKEDVTKLEALAIG